MSRRAKLLEGRVVAVTGAARGIGAATAAAFAAAGARVAVGDIDIETARRTAAEIGERARAFPLDVSNAALFEAFLAAVESDLGPLDVLVNNAGIIAPGEFLSESDDVTRAQLDVNVFGVMLGSKIAGRRFAAVGSGHIVNIASTFGVTAAPGLATYAATKHAIVGLSDALQQELNPLGVRVTTVLPGPVRTESEIRSGSLVRKIVKVEPAQVADAIVEAVADRDSGPIFVPGPFGPVLRGAHLLPRSLREGAFRFMTWSGVTGPDVPVESAHESR